MPLREIETNLLLRLQSLLRTPIAAKLSIQLGVFGEHAQGWLAIGFIGLVINWQSREPWIVAILTIAFSQLVSMVLKRLVRRRRPNHSSLNKSGKIFSELSFPSSHSMSSATAVFVLFPLVHFVIGLILIVLGTGILVSRLIIAAHFPTDVIAGAIIGIVIGFASQVLFF